MAVEFRQLITRVQARLAQASGPGTNLYSEDVIAEILQEKFNYYFDKWFLEEYLVYEQYTLDGVIGVVTGSLAGKLDRCSDILYIKTPDEVSLNKLPKDLIPDKVTGTVPKFYHPYLDDPTKVFKIVPYTSTGTIYLSYRKRPPAFTGTSIVLMDSDLLVLAATVDYLASDGTNPDATNNVAAQHAAAEARVNASLHNNLLLQSRSREQYPTRWYY